MTQKPRYSAVIFDMDGLMLDTESIAQRAWQKAAADYGYAFTDDVFLGVIGLNLPDVEGYIRQTMGEDFPFKEIYVHKQQHLDEYVKKYGIPLMPGLLELLDLLDEMFLLKAVASSSSRDIVIRNLGVAGLQIERFDAIVGGDDIRNGKPAPDIFLDVSNQLQVSPKRCLVLEDTDAGIKAAFAAGMTPVMIPDLKPPTEESVSLAYRILPDLEAVRGLI